MCVCCYWQLQKSWHTSAKSSHFESPFANDVGLCTCALGFPHQVILKTTCTDLELRQIKMIDFSNISKGFPSWCKLMPRVAHGSTHAGPKHVSKDPKMWNQPPQATSSNLGCRFRRYILSGLRVLRLGLGLRFRNLMIDATPRRAGNLSPHNWFLMITYACMISSLNLVKEQQNLE